MTTEQIVAFGGELNSAFLAVFAAGVVLGLGVGLCLGYIICQRILMWWDDAPRA